jgi:hypothetical protein
MVSDLTQEEIRWEAQQDYMEMQRQEALMGYTESELIEMYEKDINRKLTEEEKLDIDNDDDFYEFKEMLINEYWENHD